MVPAFVLLRNRAKYRVLHDGTVGTPANLLPANSYKVYRELAGVDTEMFQQRARLFIEETQDLPAAGGDIFLTLDEYRAHVSLKALRML